MSWKTGDGIKVFTRADWKARPPKGQLAPLGAMRSAVMHHGGPVGGPRWTFKDAAGTCRSWQNFHMDNHGWLDIGYHILVDGLGRLYLGRPTDRWARMSSTRTRAASA
jgi:N-acetylmuramoyl-L-alanine amidase